MVDCKDIAETLLDCLRQTECMKSGGRAARRLSVFDRSPSGAETAP